MPEDPVDERRMEEAIRLAQRAAEAGEVPVGAVIVHGGRVIGRAHNQVEALHDATAHAEMIAITQAAEALANWRLEGAEIYVTLEPCPMCAGALVAARVARVVYGAADPKAGAVRSLMRLCDDPRLNHVTHVLNANAMRPPPIARAWARTSSATAAFAGRTRSPLRRWTGASTWTSSVISTSVTFAT